VPYRGYTLKQITLVPGPERLPVSGQASADGWHFVQPVASQ
jgi:hypothetical protein